MTLSPTTESINAEIPSETNNFQQLHSNEQSVQELQQETQKLEVNPQILQTNDSSTENKSPSQQEQSLVYQITEPSTSLQEPPPSFQPTSNQPIQTFQQQSSTPSTQSLQPANIFSQSSSLFSKTTTPPPIPKPPAAVKKEIFKLIIPDVLKENFDKEGENKWRMANSDITDYFNYGFCEASFKEYTNKVRTWRGSFPMDENYQLNKYNLDKLNDHIPMDYGGCSNPNDEGLLETPQDYNPFIKEQFINSAIEYLIDSFDMMRQKTDVMEIISNKNVLSKYVQKHDENIMENRQIQEMEKEQQQKFFDPLGSYSFSKNYAEYINQRPKAIDFIALQHQIMHNIEVKNQIIQPSDRGNKANQFQGQNPEKNKLQLQQLNKIGNNSNLPSEAPKPQMLLNAIPNNMMFGQRSGGMLPLQMQLFQQMQQQQYLAQMFKTQMGMNQQPYYQQFNRNNNNYTGNNIPGMFQAYGKSSMNNNNFYNTNNGSQQQTYQDNRESQNKGLQSGNPPQNILHQSSRIGSNKQQYNNTQQKNYQQQSVVVEEETEYSKTKNPEKNKEIPKNNNKYKTKYDEDRERSRKHQRTDSSSRSSLSSREASQSSSGRKQKRKSKDNYKTDKRVKDDSYERKQLNKESRKYPKSQKDEDKYSKEQKNSNYAVKNKEFGENEKQKEYHRRDSFDKRDNRDNKEIKRNQKGQENEREKSDSRMRIQEKESRTHKDREDRYKDKLYSSKRTNEEIESKSSISRTQPSVQKLPQSSLSINSNAKTSAGGNGGISILQRIQKKSETIPTPPPQINAVTPKSSNSTITKLVIKTTENKQDQSKSYSKVSSKEIPRERERERSTRKSRSPSQSRHRHHHHSHKDRSSLPQKRSKSPQKQHVNKKTRKDSLSSSPSKSTSNLRDPPTKIPESRFPQQSNIGNQAKQESLQQKKQDDNLTIKRENSGSSNRGTSSDDRKHETHPKFFSQYFNALKKSEEDISNHSRKSSSLSDSLERSYSPPKQAKRNKKD